MQVAGKVAIVTGGGGGIGSAIAAALVEHGAQVLVADIDAAAAERVATAINARHPETAIAEGGDVGTRERVRALVARAESMFAPVDMYFANAGITGPSGLDADQEQWDAIFHVNLHAHIHAAQVLVPQWEERGSGYFVGTASAAGLLSQIGSAAYSVTKHAAVGFAEWLRITYGHKGIRVSCLCPMGVNTTLLYSGAKSGDKLGAAATRAVTSAGEVLEPAAVADVVMDAIGDERFLILPHPQVLEMYRHKGSDYDRWIRGMQRYQASLLESAG